METHSHGEERVQQQQQEEEEQEGVDERCNNCNCCSCGCIPIPTPLHPSLNWISGSISLLFTNLFPTTTTPITAAGGGGERTGEEFAGMMGTVTVPDPVPSPVEDSENLRKAFQGWGTDERAIIKILGHRIARQRVEISRTYLRLYNETLIHSLQSELSGDFGRAVILWATDPPKRDANLVNECLKKKGDRHIWPIIEIACASSPHHLVAVRQEYCTLFHSSMEEDIASHFSQQQPLGQLLVSLVTSYRYCGEETDEELAKSEASVLRDAVTKKQLFREDVIRILSTRNKSQLKTTLNLYKQDYANSFDEDIKKLGGNDRYLSLLKVAVWCLVSPEKHFAEVVRSSVVGLGTDEDSLTRAIVTRAEIDMKKFKEEYKIRYKVSLEDDVIGDTSGYYKEFLLTLLGTPTK